MRNQEKLVQQAQDQLHEAEKQQRLAEDSMLEQERLARQYRLNLELTEEQIAVNNAQFADIREECTTPKPNPNPYPHPHPYPHPYPNLNPNPNAQFADGREITAKE